MACVGHSPAQPRSCSATFNPLRTCNPFYLSNKLVFVGRLVSINERTIKFNGIEAVGTKIIIEETLKGNLSKDVKEIYLEQRCRVSLNKNERYIFTAKRMTEGGTELIISSRLSTTLKNISDEKLKMVFKEIRKVTRGVKQPRIVGKAVQYDSTRLGLSSFLGGFLDSEAGYDTKSASPLKDIEIIAVSSGDDSKTKKLNTYRAKTDSDGNFEFENLPEGFYLLSPVLPANLYVKAFVFNPLYNQTWDDSPFLPAGKTASVKVGNSPCSEDVRFNVRFLL